MPSGSPEDVGYVSLENIVRDAAGDGHAELFAHCKRCSKRVLFARVQLPPLLPRPAAPEAESLLKKIAELEKDKASLQREIHNSTAPLLERITALEGQAARLTETLRQEDCARAAIERELETGIRLTQALEAQLCQLKLTHFRAQ